MVDIFPLQEITLADLQRLVIGYTSPERYVVRRLEKAGLLQFALQREPLAKPYVKFWDLDEETISICRRAAASGFSYAAYDHGQMVGLILAEAQDWNRSLWVWEFDVAESHRRQGIGRRLISHVAESAVQGGLRVLVCETQNTNLPAIDFYRSLGFELDGIDLSYYTNQDVTEGEVAFFMKLKLES